MYYKNLDKFTLPADLISKLRRLDFTDLDKATSSARMEVVKELRLKGASWLRVLSMFRYYGFAFNRVATIKFLKLPEDLEKQVHAKVTEYFKYDFGDEMVIRIQTVSDGYTVPAHVDFTRSASIIYPLIHDNDVYTSFYSTDIKYANRRGLFDPTICQLQDRVLIKDTPCLLDVNCVHSVDSFDERLSQTNPRVSLTIKFKTLTFDEILEVLDSAK